MTTELIDNAATTAEIIANLAADPGAVIHLDGDGEYVQVAAPEGWQLSQVHNLTELAEANAAHPRRKKGKAHFIDAGSFATYVRQQEQDFTVYADLPGARFQAVFDDHRGKTPGWHEFRADFKPEPTDEFRAWLGVDGSFVSASSFAEFVEDWQHTIAAPDTADLMDLVRNFRAIKKCTFGDEINDANGDRALQWTTETSTGELSIPETLTVVAEPFQGAEPVTLTARFRYRVSDGQAVFGVKLIQPAKAWREAVEAIAAVIAADLETEILYGRPAL